MDPQIRTTVSSDSLLIQITALMFQAFFPSECIPTADCEMRALIERVQYMFFAFEFRLKMASVSHW